MAETDRSANFLKLYHAAQDNAEQLLSEAELLFENHKDARAYAIAFTALEEIAKSQLAADVFTRFIDEEEFWKHYKSHRKKIDSMEWATDDAKHYLDAEEEAYLAVEKPTIVGRMNALYVQFNGENVQIPKDVITHDDARAIIHTVRVALNRIIEVTEYFGHQIGTKGFRK